LLACLLAWFAWLVAILFAVLFAVLIAWSLATFSFSLRRLGCDHQIACDLSLYQEINAC
jgi:hypothetical protein